MKKILSVIISACCMVSVFTACTAQPQTTPDAVDTTAPAATEISSSSGEQLINAEKLDFYRNGDGVIYQTANNPMLSYISLNLTQDEDGYHLAMVNGNEYTPEYADSFVTFSDFGEVQTSVIVMEDGTQTESNNITISGCPECICLEIMTVDGMMTHVYSLYPIENYPEDTSPKENLNDFSSTLDNCSYKEYFYDDTMPDFFDDEQKNIFANATYLMQNVNTGITFDFGSIDDAVKIGDWEYYPTGMSYETFAYYTETAFTPAFSAKNVSGSNSFKNIRGELYVLDGARGANIFYTGRSFELISQSDNEIKFKLIAHCSAKEMYSEEEYDALPENEKEFDEEYTFTMIKTANGWRFSEFNYWL